MITAGVETFRFISFTSSSGARSSPGEGSSRCAARTLGRLRCFGRERCCTSGCVVSPATGNNARPAPCRRRVCGAKGRRPSGAGSRVWRRGLRERRHDCVVVACHETHAGVSLQVSQQSAAGIAVLVQADSRNAAPERENRVAISRRHLPDCEFLCHFIFRFGQFIPSRRCRQVSPAHPEARDFYGEREFCVLPAIGMAGILTVGREFR